MGLETWLARGFALIAAAAAVGDASAQDFTCDDEAGWVPAATQVTAAQRLEILALHDAARAEVGNGPLAWDDTLARYAQGWAQILVEAETRGVTMPGGYHSTDSCYAQVHDREYGENVAGGGGSRGGISAGEATRLWIDEKPFYDVAARNCSGGVCGHYIQVLNHYATTVGCGIALSGNQTRLVCNYGPIGTVGAETMVEPIESRAILPVVGETRMFRGQCVLIRAVDRRVYIEWEAPSGTAGKSSVIDLGEPCEMPGAGVEVGQSFRLDDRCVTLTAVDGTVVSWSWIQGQTRAKGTCSLAHLGEACSPE